MGIDTINGSKVGVYPVSEQSYIDVGQWEEFRASIKELVK